MEILIVGIIVVAFMAYFSTKLKKFTAEQFEREEIESAEFSLVKPEGFLHVLNDESKRDFYAYSKEYGKAEAEDMRQAEVFIESFSDKSLGEVCDGIKSNAENIVSFSETGKTCLIETEKTVDEISVTDIYKVVENGKVYQIKIKVLTDFRSNFDERIEIVLESFRVK